VFDVYLDTTDSFERFWLLRAECYECLAFSTQIWHLDALHLALLEATSSLPKSDRRARVWKWSLSPAASVSRVRRQAIFTLFQEVFPAGAVDWNFAGLPVLSRIASEIIGTPGDTIYDAFSVILPSPGQPLAS
jgi:hypothetical protein